MDISYALRSIRRNPAFAVTAILTLAIGIAGSTTMFSGELWRHRFNGDPAVVGKTMTLDATPLTVVGVLPSGFGFPVPGVDVWLTPPIVSSGPLPPAALLNSPVLSLFGRLLPEVSLEQAGAELSVFNKQYASAHAGMLDAKPNSPGTLTPLKDQLVANVATMLWMLFGAAALVLMIGCANVAGLMLARATSRSREFAVRASLGASRIRIIRQLLVESLLLAAIAGGLGVLLAKWSLNAITGMTSFTLPRTGEIRLDLIVIAFATLVSVATGVLFGLTPALSISRSDLTEMLRTRETAVSIRLL